MTRQRKLHVWENPVLHPDRDKGKPVHVIWNHEEYDYWRIHSNGTLEIGYLVGKYNEGARKTLDHEVPVTAISSTMYAKVWEEWYEVVPPSEYVDTSAPPPPWRAPDYNLDLMDPQPLPPASEDLPARERFEKSTGMPEHLQYTPDQAFADFEASRQAERDTSETMILDKADFDGMDFSPIPADTRTRIHQQIHDTGQQPVVASVPDETAVISKVPPLHLLKVNKNS